MRHIYSSLIKTPAKRNILNSRDRHLLLSCTFFWKLIRSGDQWIKNKVWISQKHKVMIKQLQQCRSVITSYLGKQATDQTNRALLEGLLLSSVQTQSKWLTMQVEGFFLSSARERLCLDQFLWALQTTDKEIDYSESLWQAMVNKKFSQRTTRPGRDHQPGQAGGSWIGFQNLLNWKFVTAFAHMT